MLPFSRTAFLVSLALSGTTLAAQQCRLYNPKDRAAVADPGSTNTNSSPTDTTPPSSVTISGSAVPTSSSTPQPIKFKYGTDKIRGVNLGGWFVLEPWITPNIFEETDNVDIIDEYTFGQLQDTNTARDALEAHWQSFYTEEDFKLMQSAGLNHVRIPVGYWSVPLSSSDSNVSTSTAPYVPGAWPHLLRALNWAKSYSLHVIVDLHGARGSQNGYDNSGQRTGNAVWGSDPQNVQHTLDVIRYIAKNVGGMVDVIELLNEAAGWKGSDWAAVIRQFWLDGYQVVRQELGQDIKIIIGDGFLTVDSWKDFLTPAQGAQGVIMDYHEYQIFSQLELARSYDEHIAFACTHIPKLSSYAQSNLWTVIGEWSNAITDCAKWLNGRGIGARWDGTYNYTLGAAAFGSCQNYTGSYSSFSNEYKAYLRKYWEVQVEIGESIQGWIFWTWKTESADEWSYRKGLEGGWIPSDPTDRMYPGLCS